MIRATRFVGAQVEQVEDERFVRGAGQYVDDITVEGLWHAAICRSSIGHGRLLSIDVRAALEMPGVQAILTGKDIPRPIPTIPFRRPNPTIGPYAQPVIATAKVRYFGEPLAIVIATSRELAEDAVEAIGIEIEPLPAVVERPAALRGDVLLFENTNSNVASTFTSSSGEIDAAFRDAHVVVRRRFSTQRQTSLPMETRGLLAAWDAAAGKLTVYGAAKIPFFNRNALAQMMGLPAASVDYIEVDVGGSFGVRGEFYPEDYLVALAARSCRHPVKWIEDRREHLMAIGHSRQSEAELELALAQDGHILGLRGSIYCDIGAYVRPNGMTPVRNAAQFTAGPYRVPAIQIEAHAYVSNKTPSGTFRGPGRYEGCFFMERLVELGASELGMDRVALRRLNLLGPEDMPYPLPTVRPSDGVGDQQCDSGDYREAFDRCLLEFDWNGKVHLDGKQIGDRYHGLGIACFIEGGASGPAETARIEAGRDGSVSVYVGSSANGQGLETIMSQIAADALGVPMDRVRVYHGSTTYLKEGWGSFGSRATVMGGSAVLNAVQNFLASFQSIAAKQLGVDEGAIAVRDGEACAADGRRVSLAQAAQYGVAGEGRFNNSKATYTYGTAAVHVAVDPGTGRVDIIDYATCDDVGRVINPLTLHGQILGAAVQGFGSVLGEELAYDEQGTLLAATLADYLVPLAAQIPRLHCVSLESYPSPNNPLGAKGAGEGGIIPVGGAVANAVASALRGFGVQPNHLPLAPYRVWQMVQDAQNSDDG